MWPGADFGQGSPLPSKILELIPSTQARLLHNQKGSFDNQWHQWDPWRPLPGGSPRVAVVRCGDCPSPPPVEPRPQEPPSGRAGKGAAARSQWGELATRARSAWGPPRVSVTQPGASAAAAKIATAARASSPAPRPPRSAAPHFKAPREG